jgi:hypothetical protein
VYAARTENTVRSPTFRRFAMKLFVKAVAVAAVVVAPALSFAQTD